MPLKSPGLRYLLCSKWKIIFKVKPCEICICNAGWLLSLDQNSCRLITLVISKFCPLLPTALSCPEGKEYQPCVRPCEARTCLNKWFYGHSSCLNLREDCVCKNGTILHRPDKTLCIPERECGKDPSAKWLPRNPAITRVQYLLNIGNICWGKLIKDGPGVGKETNL